MHLSYRPSARWTAAGEVFWQNRPGESERLFGVGTLVHWSRWFSTELAVSGGGPDRPEAFFPQVRYDLTANLKLSHAIGPWNFTLAGNNLTDKKYYTYAIRGGGAAATNFNAYPMAERHFLFTAEYRFR